MIKRKYIQLIIVFPVLVFFSMGVNAQSGTLKGVIIDSISKKPIPFVEVSLYNISKFSVYKSNITKSNLIGEYGFYSVPIDTYYVNVHCISPTYIYLPNKIVKYPSITTYLFLSEKVVIKKNKIIYKNFSGIPNHYMDDPGTIELDSIFSGQSLNSEVIERMPW